MPILKRTLIALGLAGLLLVPGVATVSQVASADETVATTPSPSATPTTTPTDNPGGDDSTCENYVEDPNGTHQEFATVTIAGKELPSPDDLGLLKSFKDKTVAVAEFSKVYKVVPDFSGYTGTQKVHVHYESKGPAVICADEGKTPKAKSPASTEDYDFSVVFSVPVPLAPVPSVPETPAQPDNAPTPDTVAALLSANSQVDEEATVEEEADVEATSEDEEEMTPVLPVTGGDKSVAGGKEAASGPLLIDDPMALVSSRAGLFALIACAGFGIVAITSVANVRRLQH